MLSFVFMLFLACSGGKEDSAAVVDSGSVAE